MLLTSPTQLRDLLSRASLVLWDFDGPVCDLFAHREASSIAVALRDIVGAAAGPSIGIEGVTDPLEVMLRTYDACPDDPLGLVRAVRKHLEEAETEAADTARPTAAAEPLMAQLRGEGKLLAIASNNCEAAIRAYLHRQGIQEYFQDRIVGRPDDPALMKPDPHSLLRLLHGTGTAAGDSVMIGDSPADARAAAAAGVPFIGYHPDRKKLLRLKAAGAAHFAADLSVMQVAAVG
ncbi:HAD hydrolase-like protein [Streptomyces sp. NBC_01142]|uniref:HAD family hydrolase n=1 Tax=Streptomyces sp. NBC_01142 TaxID=2975865 RepID=UPI0022505220|nr:HAD family hydrolase [Streptomyces sp. NBC_01142]MCX4824055.1 HAD hydrolase-like protein [Streptomyces sp. NBC_01142]